jgi:tetratricopeptide (TPR) repeat protein
MTIRNLHRNVLIGTAGLVAALVLTVWVGLATAQELPAGAADESVVNIPGEANVIQQATMSYGAGQRALKKSAKLNEKAEAASGTDREKLHLKAHEQLEKAAGEFSKAIRNNPKMHKAYVALGDTLVELDQFQDAVGVYSQAIEMEPADWQTVLSRGQAMVATNNMQGAVNSYQQLQSGDNTKAAELLGTIKGWVEYQQANPSDIPAEAVQQVETWVGQQESASS